MALVSTESPNAPSNKQSERVSTLSALNSFSEQEMRFASKLNDFSNHFLDGGEVVGTQFHCAVRCAGYLGIVFSLTHLQNMYHLEGLVDPHRSELVGQKLHEARNAAFISLEDLLEEAHSINKVLANTVRTVLHEAPYGLTLAFASPQGMSPRERVSVRNSYRDSVRTLLEDAQNLVDKHVCPCCRTIVRVIKTQPEEQKPVADDSRVSELEKRVDAMKKKYKSLEAKCALAETQLVLKDAEIEAQKVSSAQKMSQLEENVVSLRKDKTSLEKHVTQHAALCEKLNGMLEEVLGSTREPEDGEEYPTTLSIAQRSEKDTQQASDVAANVAAAAASREAEALGLASSQASDADDTEHGTEGNGWKKHISLVQKREANANLMKQKVEHHIAKVAGLRLLFSYKTIRSKKQVAKLKMDIKQLRDLQESEREEFAQQLEDISRIAEENMRRLEEDHASIVSSLESKLEKALSNTDSSSTIQELEMRVMKLEKSEACLLAENAELHEEIKRLKLAIEELKFQLETVKVRETRRHSIKRDVIGKDPEMHVADAVNHVTEGVSNDVRLGAKSPTTRSVFLRLYQDARERLIRLADLQRRVRSATMEELLKVLQGVQKAFTIFPEEYLDNVDKICEHVLSHLAGRRTVSPRIPQPSDANKRWFRRCFSASRQRSPEKDTNVSMILGSRITRSCPRLAPRRV